MKKQTLVIILLAIFVVSCLALVGCGPDIPTEEFIIAGLREIPNIVDIAAATEYNDPNGQLNKEGGYISHVFFSVDVIDQDQIYGVTLIDKGTDAGGSIEVYKTKRDAEKRDRYLASFDGTVLTSGSHKVVGTCVVRTSHELAASLQNILEYNIELMLTQSDKPYVSMDSYLLTVAKELAEKDNLSGYETVIKMVEYGYPQEKAEAVVKDCGVNFNDIAKKLAEGYEDYYATVSPLMIAELLEERLFTAENISYAVQRADIDWETYATIHARTYVEYTESFNGYVTPNDVLVYLCWEKGYIYSWDDYIFDKAEYMNIVLENLDINWNQKAVVYIEYVDFMHDYAMARKIDFIAELLDMDFTQAQAQYALANCNIDWNVRATLCLQYFIEVECTTPPTTSECIEILTEWGFTQSECNYALAQFNCKDISNIEHNYKSSVVAPTCTTQGYTIHTCSVCGDIYKDTYVKAIGHTNGEWITDRELTCTVDGSKHQACATCGATLKTETIKAKGHIAGEWTIDKEANCISRGSKHQACVACGEILKTSIIMLNGVHDFQESNTCTYCKSSITDVAVEVYNMSGPSINIVKCYVVPRSNGYDAYIKGNGAIKDYIEGSSLFDAYANGYALINVYIEYGVTSIGDYTFNGCRSLTSITIPSSVTSIGDSAFCLCFEGLTTITIPSSVTNIGENAFDYCSKLTAINVDGNNTKYKSIEGCLYSKDGKIFIKYPEGKTDTSFTIPSSVTSIGDYAFAGCDKLTSITIPDSVTSIGSSAFFNCSSLTSITIPNSVTSIGYWAFNWCSDLTSATFVDPTGWYVTITEGATSGSSLSLTSSSQSAAYLKSTYIGYYWYKK